MARALRYNPVHTAIIPTAPTPTDMPKTVNAVLYTLPLLTLATATEHIPPKAPATNALVPTHIKHLGVSP